MHPNQRPGAPKPPVITPGGGNNIIINPLQRGNPVLEFIRNVGKEFGDIVVDYQVTRTTGVLFLSLRYHRLHPEYIHTRVEKLGNSYQLRILLLLCDITEHKDPIREITKMCLINNITVITAFSLEEAGHYLATFKQFEFKPPDMIKERVDKDYNSILRSALTSISRVNKTDVETLRTSFGSFANIAKVTPEQLQNLPGFGQVKVRNIKNAFEKPVRNNITTALPSMSQQLVQGPSLSRQDEHIPSSEDQQQLEPLSSRRPGRDVNIDVVDDGNSSNVQPSASTGRESPVWDIELDLISD